MECKTSHDANITNLRAPRSIAPDEISIYVWSHLLKFGIAIFLQNNLWTTTIGDDVTSCDTYFAYLDSGCFFQLDTLTRGRRKN